MQNLKPQRAIESDSSWHFVGAQCDRADPLDHGQNSPVLFPCAVVVDTSPPPVFRCAPRPTASDAVAWQWRAAHGRAAQKRRATIPRAGAGIAATFQRAFI